MAIAGAADVQIIYSTMPCAAPILAAPNFGVCAASDPKGKWKGQVAMPGFRWDACLPVEEGGVLAQPSEPQ